jgi:branched-subunit amino acid ABC-type transport system permease component
MKGSGPDAHPGEDTHGWMPAEVRQAWGRLPEPVRRLALPLLLVVLAFLYPKYAANLPGAFPAVGTLVIMIVFTMMAVGLNIVVGYAGLLDLGYVAFYAAGAYTAAWFASLQFEQVTFHLGSVGISREAVGIHISVWLILLITTPVVLALTYLVQATRQGKAMRATSQDPEAAAMMGVTVNRTIWFTFVLAGGLAGAAGVLYLLNFTTMRYDQGFQLGLIAFTAAVLGGIGNMSGALVGAITIGLIEAFNEGLTWYTPGSDWTRSIVFGLLIAILVFRPEGLLGERTPEGQ